MTDAGAGGQTGLLFVCLGNICRSPLAEGVFIHLARRRGMAERFRVDSCGTGGWHVGERPDPRAISAARRNGVELPGHARLLDPERDFATFSWIIPMDRSNLRRLLEAGAPRERTRLLRSFDPALTGLPERDLDVPDPYEHGEQAFEEVFVMVRSACEGLLNRLASGPDAGDGV